MYDDKYLSSAYLKGNYGESLSYYLSALNGFKRLQDEHNMARCYNGLGLIQQGIGRHNQAIQYFEKYLEGNVFSNSISNFRFSFKIGFAT